MALALRCRHSVVGLFVIRGEISDVGSTSFKTVNVNERVLVFELPGWQDVVS